MKALNFLFKTDNDVSNLLLRLVLGVLFFSHGAQMVLGWFGGYGFSGAMGFFTGTIENSLRAAKTEPRNRLSPEPHTAGRS